MKDYSVTQTTLEQISIDLAKVCIGISRYM